MVIVGNLYEKCPLSIGLAGWIQLKAWFWALGWGWSDWASGRFFWQQRGFFGRVAACPHVAADMRVCGRSGFGAVCVLVIQALIILPPQIFPTMFASRAPPPPFPPLLLCTQLCEREGPVRERGWERRGIKKKEGWQEKRQRGQPPVCNVDEQTEDETHWVGQGLSEERRQSLVFMLCVCVRVWASGQLRCLLDSEWSPTVDTAGLAHSYKHWWLNCPAWQLLQVLADHSVLGWLWLGRNGVCVFGCLCVCLATSILIEAVAASF